MLNRKHSLLIQVFIFIFIFSLQLFSQTDKGFTTPYDKFAHVIVNYSLDLQPNETLLIETTNLSQELCLSVYKEALKAGAHPYIYIELPGMKEIFYQFATDSQLAYVNPVHKFTYENFDSWLYILAPANTRSLSNVDPKRIRTANRAFMEKAKSYLYDRIFNQQIKWCYTACPTQALAQEADIGFYEYEKFVFESCKLNEPDPIESWKKLSQRQQEF